MTKNTGSTNQKGPDQLLRSSCSKAAAGSMTDAQAHSYTVRRCRRLGETSSFSVSLLEQEFIHKYRDHLL